MEIQRSSRVDKRYIAIFENELNPIHFGQRGSRTYVDHHDKVLRANYIARHRVNEDWTRINAGSLSRFILWGYSTDINKNIAFYKKKFKLKD